MISHLDVVTAMDRFSKLALQGRDALVAGDVRALMTAVNDNFETRARIWPIAPDDSSMVNLGRSLGAAVKQAGSGGAVVGVLANDAMWPDLVQAYETAGFRIQQVGSTA